MIWMPGDRAGGARAAAATRREVMVGAATLAMACAPGSGLAQGRAYTPEQFGAKGDGRSNDTGALAALAARVTADGGGEISFRRGATYLVGVQRATPGGDGYGYTPDRILEIENCGDPVRIRGNGARIKCAPGLRYGTFEPRTGRAVTRPLPNYQRGEAAAPYIWMIRVANCRGAVEISDLELDGSAGSLVLGGPWGDSGHQIAAYGIGLYDNAGPETLRNIHTHHHPLDGLVIDGADRDGSVGGVIENLRSEHNGRQGCSIVGGRNYRFVGCAFNHTGRGPITSSPGAGCDIEAEGGKTVRALVFERCEFSDNAGVGLVADSGDSADVRFDECRFVGTRSWSAWPRKPSFRFHRSVFVGALCSAWQDEQAERATRFSQCTFVDDPALSPTGEVYRGSNPSAPIADLADGRNVRFDGCRFLLGRDHVLPWSTGAIYADCTMSQAARRTAYPRGIYLGTSTIAGQVDLSGSRIVGDLRVNGVRVPPTPGG